MKTKPSETINEKEVCPPAKRGSALIFATIVLFATLMVVITLSSVTVLETKMSQKTKSSTGAFFNADSGIEWAMNKVTNGSGDIATVFSGYIDNVTGKVSCPSVEYGCNVYLLDADGRVIKNSNVVKPSDDITAVKSIRAVGTKDADTSRAIEAAVAAPGSGCYISYKDGCSGDACCLSGFANEGSLGQWGGCYDPAAGTPSAVFRPPSAGCSSWNLFNLSEAFLCCK